MRLFSYQDKSNQKRVGVLKSAGSQEFIDLAATDASLPKTLLEIIATPGAMERVKQAAQSPKAVVHTLNGIRFIPLIDRPSKIVCLGLNYADHAAEGGHARPEYPSFFMRGPSSMVGHLEPMIRPKASDKFDFEAELAFVVGKTGRHLTAENALEHVAGYSVFNDGSLRDYQRKSTQWTIGKNFDATGGFGPWLVTPDELPPAADGLRIQSRLNGQIMQDANTKSFLWGVVETLVLITECMTLEPGDVVITGTPAGVGYARKPPVFMKQGDTIEVEIEGVGLLSNPIVDEK
ncbi:fumarylacetoacetate hydrolase family protein [Zwartia vadi]|uniref:fumarylacetoacetate hydrolase family protein n=1 Tax=Zwartia vadi TaxID=3058168 RepID=UPI0025B61467|nr:fumarylacetoacetate hydrolase family protein [Zwartia vadi]MDN3986939.1 fumarylacetoacetate hydrolase family protein [Zwartia vadi]